MKEKITFPCDFSGSPVVKTLHFHCRGMGSIPGQGTKILHVTGPIARAHAHTHTHTHTHTFPASVYTCRIYYSIEIFLGSVSSKVI